MTIVPSVERDGAPLVVDDDNFVVLPCPIALDQRAVGGTLTPATHAAKRWPNQTHATARRVEAIITAAEKVNAYAACESAFAGPGRAASVAASQARVLRAVLRLRKRSAVRQRFSVCDRLPVAVADLGVHRCLDGRGLRCDDPCLRIRVGIVSLKGRPRRAARGNRGLDDRAERARHLNRLSGSGSPVRGDLDHQRPRDHGHAARRRRETRRDLCHRGCDGARAGGDLGEGWGRREVSAGRAFATTVNRPFPDLGGSVQPHLPD